MNTEYIVTVEVDEDLPFKDQYATGYYLRETWMYDSKIHRQFGPAVTVFHPVTLKPLRVEFFTDGKRHRYTGPAIIEYDPTNTGKIIGEHYYEQGKRMINPGLAGWNRSSPNPD